MSYIDPDNKNKGYDNFGILLERNEHVYPHQDFQEQALQQYPLPTVTTHVISKFLAGSKYVVLKCTSSDCSIIASDSDSDSVNVYTDTQGSFPIYTLFPPTNETIY